jgi:phosphatidylinositol glycan class N
MFEQGAVPGRVDAIMYGHQDEDFTKSSIELDKFVFDNVDDLFTRAMSDPSLKEQLNRDGIVFFLHLLGIDTAGHSYRPYSAEYYDNIMYIDSKIKELEQMVESFYGDDKTAWVFTADHGMSDFGSHGDGHPDNTRTPLVAWGAGIKKPIKVNLSEPYNTHDDFSRPWSLDVQRNDVNQADIAPLMSYLVGSNYPANSVGELPLAFVDAPEKVQAEALQYNAYAIAEQYHVKEHQTSQCQLKYKPFPELSGEYAIGTRKDEIEALVEAGDFSAAMAKSEELMLLGLKGLRYLQTYNWLFLRSLVSVGFLGWIAYATTSFLHQYVVPNESKSSSASPIRQRMAAITVFVGLASLMAYQNTPINQYLYATFPVFFWELVIENWSTVKHGLRLLVQRSPTENKTQAAVVTLAFCVTLLELMVYGYFHREVYALCFGVASAWPWIQDLNVATKNLKLSLLWAVLCLALGIFTLLPVIKDESIPQILTGGVVMSLLGLYYTIRLRRDLRLTAGPVFIAGLQLGLLALSIVVTISSVRSLQARLGLPLGNQVVGWATFLLSLAVPFLHYFHPSVTDYRFRLLTIFLAFGPTFVILTISNEGLFYVSFFMALLVWVELEERFYHHANKNKTVERKLSLADFRISLFFFYLTQIGFFGIGNIPSISSFFLDSVRRLIPVFDPFAMGALLIFKILVPFIVLSVCLGILNLKLRVPKSALFSMVMAVSDILTLNFFYLVVDEGSWLDIGTGISHFCICSALCLFLMMLEYLSDLLVDGVTVSPPLAQKGEKAKQ